MGRVGQVAQPLFLLKNQGLSESLGESLPTPIFIGIRIFDAGIVGDVGLVSGLIFQHVFERDRAGKEKSEQ